MKRAFALLLFAMSARSDITIAPAGPVYVDDVLIVTITGRAAGVCRPNAHNLTLTPRQAGWVYVYTAVPTAPGPAWIEAEIYAEGSNTPSERVPRMTFTVLPDIARSSDDPATIFRAQRAAKRPPVYARATASTYRAFPGQRIDLWWTAISDDSSLRFDEDFHPQPEGLDLLRLGRIKPIRTMVGGLPVTQFSLEHAVVIPKEPGTLHIPEYEVVTDNKAVRRFTNAFDIEVVPAPAEAAKLPIGKYTLDCRSAAASYWPKVTIDVVGNGDASSAGFPRLTSPPPNVPIVIWGGAPRVEFDANHHQWTYEVHSRDPQLVVMPDVAFDHYDPETRRAERATCGEPPLLVRSDEPPKATEQPVVQAAVLPGMKIAQYITGLFALAGVIVVFTAMRQ